MNKILSYKINIFQIITSDYIIIFLIFIHNKALSRIKTLFYHFLNLIKFYSLNLEFKSIFSKF